MQYAEVPLNSLQTDVRREVPAVSPVPISKPVGALFVLLGVVALAVPAVATIASTVTIGVLLGVAGLGHMGDALRGERRAWSAFLALVTLLASGALVIAPVEGAVTLTFVLGVFLLLGGLMRFTLMLSTGVWSGLLMLSAVTGMLLGVLLIASWPLSGLSALGVFLGVDFILGGVTALAR